MQRIKSLCDNKLETEENFRRVVSTVDGIGRCVLFIDEIEKSLNRAAVSGTGDTGTSSRSFATLLTWLSEHKSPVFVVGTSNDHTKLPTEFTRKGRFDELFWIDLPSTAEREEIFSVLLQRYSRDPKKFKLKSLAEATKNFTGAEIEQVIIGAMYDRFSRDGQEFTNVDLMDAINDTQTLAKTDAASIEEMRNKARGKLRVATASGITVDVMSESSSDSTRKLELGNDL